MLEFGGASSAALGNGGDLGAGVPPSERRRYERNMREQQRSYRISQQIKQLRDVLEENKIPFKPNKFSILVSVVEYIKQLQSRSIMLDSEHARLMDTVRQTTELVHQQQQQNNNNNKSNSGSDAADEEEEETGDEGMGNSNKGGFALTTSNGNSKNHTSTSTEGPLDLFLSSSSSSALSSSPLLKDMYPLVFAKCPAALGIASLDGRVLACNSCFEGLLGVQQDQVFQQSMFVYIRNHQDIFEAMADLLKRSSAATEVPQSTTTAGATAPPTTALPPSTVPGGGTAIYVAPPESSDNHHLKTNNNKATLNASSSSLSAHHILYWCGSVISLHGKRLAFTISLTNTNNGDPKYFALSAAQVEPEQD